MNRDEFLNAVNNGEVNFEGLNLDGWNLDDQFIPELNLKGASCVGTSFMRAILCDINFEGANLSNAHFEGADLRGAKLININQTGTSFKEADLDAVQWETPIDTTIRERTFNASQTVNYLDVSHLRVHNHWHGDYHLTIQLSIENINYVHEKTGAKLLDEARQLYCRFEGTFYEDHLQKALENALRTLNVTPSNLGLADCMVTFEDIPNDFRRYVDDKIYVNETIKAIAEELSHHRIYRILEPYYKWKMRCPIDFIGNVAGLISQHHGRLEEITVNEEIIFSAPLREKEAIETGVKNITNDEYWYIANFERYDTKYQG